MKGIPLETDALLTGYCILERTRTEEGQCPCQEPEEEGFGVC